MTDEQHRASIQSVIVRVAHEIDRKQWRRLRALYADQVETDYSALFGGTPQRQHGDELVSGWEKTLGAVSTQHLLGPVDVAVTGETATAQCHVRAWHRANGCAGGDEWVVAGHYTFRLAKVGEAWSIDMMGLQVFHQTGNTKLLEEASART